MPDSDIGNKEFFLSQKIVIFLMYSKQSKILTKKAVKT